MKNKPLSILVAVLFIWANCFAQQKEDNLNAIQFQRDFVNDNLVYHLSNSIHGLNEYDEEKYKKFKRMRTSGIILSGVGSGLIIYAITLPRTTSDDIKKFIYSTGALVLLVAGPVLLGVGVTVWIIGNNKMKKYGGGPVTLKNTKSGVGLVYNF